MDGGGGQKYGLLNRGSAILKSTFVLDTFKNLKLNVLSHKRTTPQSFQPLNISIKVPE